MINIVLVEPEIPSNTGNIARTCALTGANLHLVRPLGFDTDDRSLKRAGLDYWERVNIIYHESLEDFLTFVRAKENASVFLLSTKAAISYDQANFSFDKEIYLVFGKETRGLPEDLIFSGEFQPIKIPMTSDILRSLNLSNAAAIVTYEALRQNGFRNLG